MHIHGTAGAEAAAYLSGSPMEKKLVNIFSYVDFKRYLSDAYAARSGIDRKFSKTFICRQAGLPNSRSYFSDIVAGKKPLSKAKMELMIPIFELRGDEAQYFRLLVLYNQTAVKDEKEFYLDQLIALNRTPWKLVDRNAYEYYREWYTSAIRAYLDIASVGDDCDHIAKAIYPPITTAQARAAMDLLKRLGFIRKDKDGHWKPQDKIIFSQSQPGVSGGPEPGPAGGPADGNEAVIKRYQAKCIELSLSAIYDGNLKPKSFATRTLSVSSDIYDKIEKKMQKFLSEVRSLVHKDEKPADRICQLNVQLFPQAVARP